MVDKITCPPPQTMTKVQTGRQEEGQVSPALGQLLQGPRLLPCKQALGVWFHRPQRMDVQPLFQKVLLDSGLQYAHDLDTHTNGTK